MIGQIGGQDRLYTMITILYNYYIPSDFTPKFLYGKNGLIQCCCMEKKLFGDSKMDTFDISIVYIINLDFSIIFAHFSHTTTLYDAMLLYGRPRWGYTKVDFHDQDYSFRIIHYRILTHAFFSFFHDFTIYLNYSLNVP